MATDYYALTFQGDNERGYHGVYALPGDPHWRYVRYADGSLLWRKTPQEAEADAAHRLVAALNRSQPAAPALLTALQETLTLLDGCMRNAQRLGQPEFAARIGTMISVNRAAIANATAA